ncbi:DUF3422 domain-containing protein [Paracoccus sp. Z118]|uniref:DUF3422 family protein n=1 Tax=Paracoccus sp. Z118 TaxID=2851017 RepID=UPI001C2B8AD4|nr:DUF3422 domain-containing protein [Paracoccus sp. Z118]MBV0893398.1 DUF3422 domain-containing protein [Paracoccus sp. Z118]
MTDRPSHSHEVSPQRHDLLDHPLRCEMVDELHARPSPRLTAPCTAVHVAFKEPRDAAARDRGNDLRHLSELLQRYGAPAPAAGAGHHVAMLGQHELRWESHSEFVSYAGFTSGRPDCPFDPALTGMFPAEWQARAPGRRVAATIVHITPMPEDPGDIAPLLSAWFAVDGLVTARVHDGAAVVATDFRIDPAGWMRIAVFTAPGTGDGRIGRIVQRLLELEAYRAMSMLALPRVRTLSATMNALEARLTALVERLGDDTRPPDAALHDLLDLSQRLESQATQHEFRFGATRAYEAIVHDRIAALRETRFQGRQTLNEFMVRRYQPAMRTVQSAERRLGALIERATRAGELLRTRVDVHRSGQNQALLERMDRRAELQLRLQHTVEGLSVFAISYYAVGLLGYLAYPLAEAAAIERGILVAALTPLVIVAVWLGMRRVRARLHDAAANRSGRGKP